MLATADRRLRPSIWKIHHPRTRAVWGTGLLAEHEHTPSSGSLYPALACRAQSGRLRRAETATHARARRVFWITLASERLLRREVMEAHQELVGDRRRRS